MELPEMWTALPNILSEKMGKLFPIRTSSLAAESRVRHMCNQALLLARKGRFHGIPLIEDAKLLKSDWVRGSESH